MVIKEFICYYTINAVYRQLLILSPVVQVITGLFPFLPITVRLILKIGKPIKNQVKGTVRMQSLLSSEID